MDIRDDVARLAIEHPDPTEYDRGYNDAIRRALAAIDAAGQSIPDLREPSTPMQRRIVRLLRDVDRPLSESEIRAGIFPTLPPDERPRLTAALGALARHGFVRRVAGGHERYTLP